jgi:hypothetical protein
MEATLSTGASAYSNFGFRTQPEIQGFGGFAQFKTSITSMIIDGSERRLDRMEGTTRGPARSHRPVLTRARPIGGERHRRRGPAQV